MESESSSDGSMSDNANTDIDDAKLSYVEDRLQEFFDVGDPVWECQYCRACMWYHERHSKTRNSTMPKFQRCCRGGKVKLPLIEDPPDLFQTLLFDHKTAAGKNYQANIRTYNAMFSFTSPDMKFDSKFSKGGGPPTLRLHGQTCHRIGTLLPERGQPPKYAQLYIYDTDNEVDNRMECFRDNKEIDRNIVTNLKLMLDQHNVHAKAFRMARDMLKDHNVENLKLRLISECHSDGRVYNKPTVSEVAALIVGDIDSGTKRDIIIQDRGGHLQRIDEFHPSYLAFQYPLLFPYGEDGFRDNILHAYEGEVVVTKRNRQTIMEWLSYRLQKRKSDARTILSSKRLFHQFLVDSYTMMETERLNWLRKNQLKLRVGKYHKLKENQDNTSQQTNTLHGKRVVLPSTFVGGRRYMDQLYFDGMAISSALGFPDLFLTFTCNPNWPEITRELAKDNLKPQDRPDIISRIFKIKFDALMVDVTRRHILGEVLAFIYTIEFQKRGLPHAHVLIFPHPKSKYPNPSDIDKIISCEIPDPTLHPRTYNLVKQHMMHGPCGLSRLTSPCMKNRRCSKFFPKSFSETTIIDENGYPQYRRRSQTQTIIKHGIPLDNRHVVPYNTRLLLKYEAHINMEWCNQCTSIKYLFKYIHKGYDRITASLVQAKQNIPGTPEAVDEIQQYLDYRYISPSEACWRIFSFKIHGRKPAVERMFYHLIGEKPVYFIDHSRMENVLEQASVTESMFSAWMIANAKYVDARSLTYGQFVTKFVYDKRGGCWKPRTKGFTIGRLIWVPPITGELFYLRIMLTVVKGPTSYDEIRKVDGTQLFSFRDACFAMGFLQDDKEYIMAIKESTLWGSGHFLRKLFVIMLLSGSVNSPSHVWAKTWTWLSDGILHEQRNISCNPGLILSDDEIQNLTLTEIEKILQTNRRTLKDFPSIPYPKGYILQQLGNRLIYEERNYDVEALKAEFSSLSQSLTDEQHTIFTKIIAAVDKQNKGIFFLRGHGGTGKTFMWRTLESYLRSKHRIVLTVASSGIASLLLPDGRTANSKFKLPVPTLDNSLCNISPKDDLAELIRQTELIIWDEAPMAHRFCFEALDRTLRDIMRNHPNSDSIFSGKVVVFGGDFRQILPVVPKGSRSDIVHSTLNASYIWDHCEVLNLTKNMRLQQGSNPAECIQIECFSKWLLSIGEGRVSEPNDGYAEFDIPDDILITTFNNPIEAIVKSTYPDFEDNYKCYDYLRGRAILAATIETVDKINEYVLSTMEGETREYYSSNSVDRSEIHDTDVLNLLTPEFLNSLKTSGLPSHHIKLKIGSPVMLMRNLDQSDGLCNGTRLIVTNMASHVIEGRIMGGKGHGNIVHIPRMDMSPSQSPWPFKLKRR